MPHDDVGDNGGNPCVRHRQPHIKHFVIFVADADHESSARFHFHSACQVCAVRFIVWQERDARRAFFHKRERSVLEFACGKTLGMDIGNLLDLERNLECRGI